jgi:hypothetical protein
MKKFISSKIILGIVAIGMVGFFSSCLSNNNTRNSQIAVLLQLKGTTKQSGRADTILVAGKDSLTISNLRLIHGRSRLIRQSDSLTLPVQMLRFSSTPSTNPRIQSGNRNVLVQSNAQIIPGTYKAFDLKIIQAADSLKNQIPIADIFNDNGHYSIVIQGEYDGSDFTFKSKKGFDRKLAIKPQIDIPQHNAVVHFIVSASVRNWFLNNSGGFYDPSDSTNRAAINANIQNSFQITTKSRGTGTM